LLGRLESVWEVRKRFHTSPISQSHLWPFTQESLIANDWTICYGRAAAKINWSVWKKSLSFVNARVAGTRFCLDYFRRPSSLELI
jgi:hypothetical protein